MREYYLTFYQCLISAVLACTVLQSGKLDDTTSSKAGKMADAIDFVGKQIPIAGMGATLIAKIIRCWDANQKQLFLNAITECFSDMELNLKIIAKLACFLALQVEENLNELVKQNSTTWEKFKAMLASIKDKVDGTNVNTVAKKLGEAHAQIILTAIAQRQFTLALPPDDKAMQNFVEVCAVTVLGKLIKVTVSPAVVLSQETTATEAVPTQAAIATKDDLDSTMKMVQRLQCEVEDLKRCVSDVSAASGESQMQLHAVRSPAVAKANNEDVSREMVSQAEALKALSLHTKMQSERLQQQDSELTQLRAMLDKMELSSQNHCVIA